MSWAAAHVVRLATVVTLALALAGCDFINSAKDAFKDAQATAADLETTTGVRPNIGFNWSNGHLTQVTVTFPRLLEGKPMPELVDAVRAAIRKDFKQEPENIILSFIIPKPLT